MQNHSFPRSTHHLCIVQKKRHSTPTSNPTTPGRSRPYSSINSPTFKLSASSRSLLCLAYSISAGSTVGTAGNAEGSGPFGTAGNDDGL